MFNSPCQKIFTLIIKVFLLTVMSLATFTLLATKLDILDGQCNIKCLETERWRIEIYCDIVTPGSSLIPRNIYVKFGLNPPMYNEILLEIQAWVILVK